MSKNEKKTENLSRKLLSKAGIFDNSDFLVEEQKSDNPLIQKLLKSASKSGTGFGKPEFIITAKDKDKEFLIVIECKADTKYHVSETGDNFKDYAVDGVLLYSSYLSKEYNVISIGISGEDERNLKISTYFQAKGSKMPTLLKDENSKNIEQILEWDRYIKLAKFDPKLAEMRHKNLMKFSKDLHDYLRDYAKITEAQKPLIISGILVSLMDLGFKEAYKRYESQDLATACFDAIKKQINKFELGEQKNEKKNAVINAFSFIEYHPELQKFDTKRNESPLMHIIKELDMHVDPFTKDHYDFDIIGNFYGEFIRYTGGDGKGLGIVLTPKHITDLFSDLANVDKNSIVLDICAGTSGFLISAMKKMVEKVDADQKKKILENNLIGIEQEPQMFALAVSNMILRGDGKTNLYQGSCFDDSIFNKVRGKANAGFINPPYSQKGENLHEWDFILRMLDGLQKNATGIAIVPMSLAIDTKHPLREKLLKEHRLEAVMSMPDDLFYPVGTVTCIMVFTAHTPHDTNEHHETWFGYWKDDGFRKDKVQGRIPKSDELWNSIKKSWIEMFRRKEIPGKSVWKKVKQTDEWCAEAYLETDYSDISDNVFINNLVNFASFSFKNGNPEMASNLLGSKNKKLLLKDRNWETFTLDDLFNFEKGERLTKTDRIEGNTPLLTAGESNNGVAEYISLEEFKNKKKMFENKITVDMFFNVFYHNYQYFSDDNIHTLIPKGFNLSQFSSLFIVSVLSKLKYKYAYGRQVRLLRLPYEKICLPVDKNGNPDWKFMEDYIKNLPYPVKV